MKVWQALAIVGLGIGLVSYAVLSSKTDAERIAEQLERLEQTVEIDGDENLILRGNRIKGEFEEIFVKDVTIKIPELTSLDKGRGPLAGVATQAGARFRSADIDFGKLDITVGNSGANVKAPVTLTATERGGRVRRDRRDIRLTFVKSDGDWLISRVRVISKSGARLDVEPE